MLNRKETAEIHNIQIPKKNELAETEHNQQWSYKLYNITKGHKKLWKLTKNFKGKSESTVNKIRVNGITATDDTARANCLAKTFGKSHTITANYTHENDATVRHTVQSFNMFRYLNVDTPTVNSSEVHNIIKSLRSFKSPGADTIQNILLKNLPASAIEFLTTIFNKCMKLSYWPTSFKIAKIIPILKAGKSPTDTLNYRPISLLNAMGKLFERIIYQQLIEFIDKRIRKSIGMILLDIEKAFDSIWHDGLLYKLIKMKLPTYLIRLLESFIRKRKFAVYVNNATSNTIEIPAGLAQGTCISPILYALYIADIPIVENTQLALYADDTSIYTSAKQSNTIINRLNHALQTLAQYFHKWKIKINPAKTQAILFPFDNKRRRIPTIKLKGEQHDINFTDSVNYLGIIFDKKLTFAHHITSALNKTNKCYRAS